MISLRRGRKRRKGEGFYQGKGGKGREGSTLVVDHSVHQKEENPCMGTEYRGLRTRERSMLPESRAGGEKNPSMNSSEEEEKKKGGRIIKGGPFRR